MLRQTRASKATDPRDKVFGILGPVDTKTTTNDLATDCPSGQETIDYSLVPNYYLSSLETYIGITAYVMITLGHWQILENAAGVNAMPGYPRCGIISLRRKTVTLYGCANGTVLSTYVVCGHGTLARQGKQWM